MQHKIRLGDGREFGPATMDLILQWAREGRIPADAMLVSEDDGRITPVLADPQLASVLRATPIVPTGPPQPAGSADDGIATIIPYRNLPALVAYYLGVFSLLPIIGIVLAIPAFILGIIGLRKRARNPQLKGAVHAWIGIILGGLFTLIWGGLILIWGGFILFLLGGGGGMLVSAEGSIPLMCIATVNNW